MMATEKRLIYADELKTAICDDVVIDGVNYAKMKKHIDEAKTVDAVEVVHGQWIGGYCGTGYITPKCSQCGYGDGAVGTTNYCPNCGAKMDGDGND